MSIVGGLDMHRKQITFDYLDTMTGALCRGKITPADRLTLRQWLGRFADYPESVRLVVEGCTGWRYVVEECRRAGIDIHVAEPADTASARGPKRHAKTDKLDAKHLRELLVQGRIPESWIPPEQVLEMRVKVRLYKDLRDERSDWIQQIRATLYHQGVPALPGACWQLATEPPWRPVRDCPRPVPRQ
jgi:transposase